MSLSWCPPNGVKVNILFYAKERRLQLETVDTAEFTREVIATVQLRTDGKPLALQTDLANAPAQLVIDPESFHSALVSILDNAIDACLKDTQKDKHRIDFTIEKNVNAVVFDIRDNGIGMDRETREKIFTLFFSSKDRKGTGLGLYIADRIIAQHNGQIEVESQPGRGSCFRIRIPGKPLPPENLS